MKTRASALGLTMMIAAAAAPAAARPAPSTTLVSCGGESCLLVRGHRASAAAPVLVNGHAVAVEGQRSWRVRLPVALVRQWSAPFARTLAIASAGADGAIGAAEEARLPIGLLGLKIELASLVVRAH